MLSACDLIDTQWNVNMAITRTSFHEVLRFNRNKVVYKLTRESGICQKEIKITMCMEEVIMHKFQELHNR